MNAPLYSIHLPRDTELIAIIRALSAQGTVVAQPPISGSRQWLDSFDWRVHASGRLLERTGGPGHEQLRLSRGDDPDWVIEWRATEPGKEIASLHSTVLRRHLTGALAGRVLLPRCEVRGQLRVLTILDRREKVIARVEVWRRQRRGMQFIRITPLRGYRTAAKRIAKGLRAIEGAQADGQDPLHAAAARLDIAPGAYPSWQLKGLSTDTRADDALMDLLTHYTRVMDLNLPGMREALDSEFLHQFRIGLRRSRALLRHSPGVLAAARVQPLADKLLWIGEQTGPVRDADVHAMVFPDYITSLNGSDNEVFAPMMAWVAEEREQAHRQFQTAIAGRRFRSAWRAWLQFVDTPAPRASRQPMGPLALKSVAPDFVAAAARRVVRGGRRIDERSPAGQYHDLRKSCKNLRYLIDAYGFVLSGKSIKRAVTRLKSLQDLLGEHQDLDVHHSSLCTLHERMARRGDLPHDTHQAMEALLASLSARARHVRCGFAEEFAAFRKLHLSRLLINKSR